MLWRKINWKNKDREVDGFWFLDNCNVLVYSGCYNMWSGLEYLNGDLLTIGWIMLSLPLWDILTFW